MWSKAKGDSQTLLQLFQEQCFSRGPSEHASICGSSNSPSMPERNLHVFARAHTQTYTHKSIAA